MQNKEKCLHATLFSKTVLIPTIQNRQGNGSGEGERREGGRGGREGGRGEREGGRE